jgi:hypothetical protein
LLFFSARSHDSVEFIVRIIGSGWNGPLFILRARILRVSRRLVSQELDQLVQVGKSSALLRSGLLKGSAPDTLFPVARLPHAKQVRKIALLFRHGSFTLSV